MFSHKNESHQTLEIGTKEYFLSTIKICATENLVFVLKNGANGKGNELFCLYYEDSKIHKTLLYNGVRTGVEVLINYDG
jgi:hypothetical protein